MEFSTMISECKGTGQRPESKEESSVKDSFSFRPDNK